MIRDMSLLCYRLTVQDTIAITDLELMTHIGVPDEECAKPQRVLVSIVMETDASAVGQSDDVADTIDYDQVVQSVRTLAKTERKTIEKFAEDIAQTVLKDWKPSSVAVTVKKFVFTDAKDVSVTITRNRA